MTAYLREHYPDVKIILGGAGCVIPDLKKLISYDDICHGDRQQQQQRAWQDGGGNSG